MLFEILSVGQLTRRPRLSHRSDAERPPSIAGRRHGVGGRAPSTSSPGRGRGSSAPGTGNEAVASQAKIMSDDANWYYAASAVCPFSYSLQHIILFYCSPVKCIHYIAANDWDVHGWSS